MYNLDLLCLAAIGDNNCSILNVLEHFWKKFCTTQCKRSDSMERLSAWWMPYALRRRRNPTWNLSFASNLTACCFSLACIKCTRCSLLCPGNPPAPCKTAAWIEVLFEVKTFVDPRNIALDGVPDPSTARGGHTGHLMQLSPISLANLLYSCAVAYPGFKGWGGGEVQCQEPSES